MYAQSHSLLSVMCVYVYVCVCFPCKLNKSIHHSFHTHPSSSREKNHSTKIKQRENKTDASIPNMDQRERRKRGEGEVIYTCATRKMLRINKPLPLKTALISRDNSIVAVIFQASTALRHTPPKATARHFPPVHYI